MLRAGHRTWPRSRPTDGTVYKPGKVAVVLSGRQAGKKVVVIQQRDEGTKERPYPHAIVAGIERYVSSTISISGCVEGDTGMEMLERFGTKAQTDQGSGGHGAARRVGLDTEGDCGRRRGRADGENDQ